MDALLGAARQLAAEDSGRGVPSPSSTPKCTRRNWYIAKGQDPDNFPDNGESYVAAESGRLTESLLASLVEKAGIGIMQHSYLEGDQFQARELTPEECERIGTVGGQVDNVAVGPGGVAFLVEFKRKGVFALKDLHRDGILEAEPDDYSQLQALMAARQLPQALYIVANWDRGAWTMQTRKWDGGRPDGLYAEWVSFNAPVASALRTRALMQRGYMNNGKDAGNVPRDFDDWTKFPCTWCPFLKACKEAG